MLRCLYRNLISCLHILREHYSKHSASSQSYRIAFSLILIITSSYQISIHITLYIHIFTSSDKYNFPQYVKLNNLKKKSLFFSLLTTNYQWAQFITHFLFFILPIHFTIHLNILISKYLKIRLVINAKAISLLYSSIHYYYSR